MDNIHIRFGTKLYRQIVGIPMGTNCAPLVADLFLFCYEIDFMTSLSDVKQAEIIKAFKSTSRCLDDLLNIDNPYFEGMVNRMVHLVGPIPASRAYMLTVPVTSHKVEASEAGSPNFLTQILYL